MHSLPYVAMTRAIHHVHLIAPDDRGLLYRITDLPAKLDVYGRIGSPFLLFEIRRWKGARLHYDWTMLPNHMAPSRRNRFDDPQISLSAPQP